MTDEETAQFEHDLAEMLKVPEGYQMPDGWQERVLARYEAEELRPWRRLCRWIRKLFRRA